MSETSASEQPSSSSLANGEQTENNSMISEKPAINRTDMVETAKQFLRNPRVQGTPVEDQKKFLRSKGLTDGEIEDALHSLGAPPNQTLGTYAPQQANITSQTSGGSRFLAACQSAILISGASYMAYKLVRTWLLPKFFDIPDPAQEQVESLQIQMNDIQNSSKFIMDSVVQTLETVSAQQEQLNRAIMLLSSGGVRGNEVEKIHAELSIVKSLLLNQNQFPPLPDHSTSTKHGRMNGYTRNGYNSLQSTPTDANVKDESASSSTVNENNTSV